MLDLNLAKAKMRDSLRQSSSWPFLPYADAVRLSAVWQLWDLESAGAEKIRNWQSWKLKQLLAHMQCYSSFWKERTSQRISSLADLPVLTRAMLREQVELEGPLRESDKTIVSKESTSGTSGQPLHFYVSAYNGEYNQIRYLLENFIQGRDLSQPKASVKRFAKNFDSHKWTDVTGLLFNTGPHRGCDSITHSISEIASWIEAKPVVYLHILPQFLQALFAFYAAQGKPAPQIREIISLGGTVTSELRSLALQKMGAVIKDIYSSHEVGPIAFQCPSREDSFHVASSNVFLEVVDDAGKTLPAGTLGRILVTALNSLITPVVRYEIGDTGAVLPRCPCGWDGQTVTNLLGRTTALLKLPDGQLRPFYLSAKEWLPIAPLKEYRVTQDTSDHLLVELVAGIVLTPEMKTAFAQLTRLRTSELFRVTIVQMDSIDWGNNYKRVDVRCLV